MSGGDSSCWMRMAEMDDDESEVLYSLSLLLARSDRRSATAAFAAIWQLAAGILTVDSCFCFDG